MLTQPTPVVALLPQPATINCLICGEPLRSIIEVPNKKHARCLHKEMRLKAQLRLIKDAVDTNVVELKIVN
jgi:hypothetical protein